MEVLGQLLAAHGALRLLSDTRQAGQFAARALVILPGAHAAAACLEGETVLDGSWGESWTDALTAAVSRPSPPTWHELGDGRRVLALTVATVHHHYGGLLLLLADHERVEQYVPFLANFAADLALTLDNRRQQAEVEAANQQLQASRNEYRLLFEELSAGFAVHEILTDEHDRPVDYRFLEINRAFEELTGLRASDVVGRTALEVLPDLEPSWIETYGDVALSGRSIRFENYSVSLDRYYSVIAYCPSPRRFATLFTDITERRRQEEALSEAASLMEAAYHRERELAEQLQRALLPAIPTVPGLEIDGVYVAASDIALVGGDFYDVTPLPTGKVLVAIGDVCGKGTAATGRMAMTLFTLRALMMDEPDLGDCLTEANRRLIAYDHAQGGRDGDFVTVTLMLFDTAARTVRYAMAGHPGPRLAGPAGQSELAAAGPTLPLGIQPGMTYQTGRVEISAGDLLCLFTDGLTERRRGDELFGDRLDEELRRLVGLPLAGEAARLVERARRFGDGHMQDDTIVLLLRITR